MSLVSVPPGDTLPLQEARRVRAPSRGPPRAPRRSFRLLVGIVLPLGVGTGAAFADGRGGLDGAATDVPADDPALVARGEIVYRGNCASCHGVELEGQPDWRTRDASGLLPAPPHDAEGHTWHHADDLLFEIVKYGPGAVIGDETYRSAMPAYEGVLPDADIVAVLAYIKHSWPAEQRRWQAEVDGATGVFEKPAAPSENAPERLLR